MLQGVVHQRADGTIIDMNPAAERILGKTREEFLGSSSGKEERGTVREDGTPFPGKEHPAMVALRTGQPVRGVVMGVFNPRRKERRWISVDAVPIIRPEDQHPNQVYTVFADITEPKQAEGQGQADLMAMTRLQQIGAMFAQEGNLEPVLGAVVDAAIAISGADFGNVQLLHPKAGVLQIAAQRGFPQWWVDSWNNVTKSQGVCGTALERGERVIVQDVEQSPIFAGTPALEVQRRAGVRAVQSTPLVTRSGKALGVFSTHYKTASAGRAGPAPAGPAGPPGR